MHMILYTILIADSRLARAKKLAVFFEAHGFTVITASTTAETVEQAEIARPDCILLDFHLRDANADQVCGALQAKHQLCRIPVIIISSGLDQELWAYSVCRAANSVRRNTPPVAILAVVEAAIERARRAGGVIEKGDLKLTVETQQVHCPPHRPLQLSPSQFHLLQMLVETSPGYVSEADISSHIFSGKPDADNSDAVKMLVYRLRLKLGSLLGGRIRSKKNSGWTYRAPASEADSA